MSAALGYGACLIAILCFGSNFVPIKRVQIGDGVFSQFMMCNGIFMTSLPILAIQNFPPFHRFAMLGGVLWCTGNMLCGPVINLIGMGMGLLIWGSTNMLMGWATGTFGLFGLDKGDVSTPALNYAGVGLALIGLYVFLQVQTNEMGSPPPGSEASTSLLHDTDDNPNKTDIEGLYYDDRKSHPKSERLSQSQFGAGWNQTTKRIVGLLMACTAGVLFGTSFNPAQWVIDNRFDGDDNTLNYVFPQFTGILLASWTYTMLYFLYKYSQGQAPYVNPDCVIPATISGIMWGIACIAWFVANGKLGFAVAFPIITSGPGFIGSLYGIFLFKEISGQKNLLLLATAFVITVPGLIMVALAH